MTTNDLRDDGSTPSPHVSAVKGKIAALGAAISTLETALTDNHREPVAEVQRRYDELRQAFGTLEQEQRTHATRRAEDYAAMERVKAQAQRAWTDAQQRVNKAYEDVRAFATDERNGDALRKSARDVGQGFTHAWSEVSASFDKAMGRFRNKDERKPTAGQPEQRKQPLAQLNESSASDDSQHQKSDPATQPERRKQPLAQLNESSARDRSQSQ